MLTALAQNNCGPQYANAAQAPGGGNFLTNLFGGNSNPIGAPPGDLGPQSGTFRTVCVRTCDGAYFPISFATVPARFPDDEKACKALCPAAEASLYAYRNPGEDMNAAVSISGQPYTALPNAFKFRAEFNPSCSCKAAGQSWADALKSADDKAAVEQLEKARELGQDDPSVHYNLGLAYFELKDYEKARAEAKQTEASVKLASANLGYSIIRAPIDGVVIARNVDVGQTVAASFQAPTLFLIANDLTQMQGRAQVRLHAKALDEPVRVRGERHNPISIATLRITIARYLLAQLPCCPFCGGVCL